MLDLQALMEEEIEKFSQRFSYLGDGRIERSILIGSTVYSHSVSSVDSCGDPTIDYFRNVLNKQKAPVCSSREKKLNYIDLFCGGGGLSLGVHQAASLMGRSPRLLAAVDIDTNALKLVNHHFKPLVSRAKSIEDLIRYQIDLSGVRSDFITPPEVIDSQIAQFKGRVDLIVGGPPCQGHSGLNNKTRGFDPRNLLYYMMPAFAVALEVPTVIIENVRNISAARENVVQNTRNTLEYFGYKTEELVVNSSTLGVAQARTRHFLVCNEKEQDLSGFLDSMRVDPISYDQINSNLPSLINVNETIEKPAELSQENIDRINFLHDNNVYDLPNSERPDCHKDGHSYPSVYGRIKGHLPMGTITTGFSSPGRGRYVHPHERRGITIREAARVQSFPDWYWEPVEKLGIVKNHLTKIVGDAVPSQMVTPLVVGLLAKG
jgi:DNA (cytosine-5)-methyltransferase 1